ncbi:protein DEFECTIVE IN MERISTEM SILENCING 3 isoform X1 [Phoenix dactylifera]|uniref:Protein DEFECTIVE IN MERISTEM SILENCING 3 isoform X1 n=1 Tax=Phoenix dactylifera TaxID=42345 RepID=A0A8B7BQB6_PHODC|nr:protein DEFECTIVE IN MERISTEM SILENCING 3 isoform X1 [Phoenix dactylifera]
MLDGEMRDGEHHNLEIVKNHTQKLQDELQKLALKVKHHEDNMKFLKTQMDNIDESILDMQVNLGKYHSSSAALEQNNDVSAMQSEQQTVGKILQQEKAAAGIICQMKIRHGLQASKLQLTKDVLGIVATLGKVNDDNLSRLFSEYLGLETMLAIVCKTYEGIKALEKYDKEGMIDQNAGLHGLGPSIGRLLNGRFLVFCLENLRPYIGEFVPEDPQKKLALLKPRLPNGEIPRGFIGFAVNMINVDHMHLSCLTPNGHGLRETLFYTLFSRLQVYKTRADMQSALPCVSDGAISLDGGMIKSSGLFNLGDRKDVEVKFPISPGISKPADVIEIEEKLKLMNWQKERLEEDVQREEALLNNAKNLFNIQKQELVKYLGETASHIKQAQSMAGRTGTFRLELLPNMT